MHPSSFYDLQARYVYTPLHGPYSLSEALDGLISYSLHKSRDFISIGSKRTLRHELISELSNVVDDLQDYLVYFSSRFLISPPNSPDLIKELWASCNGPEFLTVCWGALITRLIFARKIVERNFWPHFFHPTINNPTALQGLERPPSFVLPNTSWNKSFASASASIPFSHINSTPRSPAPFESRHAWIPCCTQIPSNHRPSDLFPDSHIYKERLNEDFALPNNATAALRLSDSTSIHNSDVKELGDSKDDARVVGDEEKVAAGAGRVIERGNITETMPARTSTASQPLSMGLQPSSTGLLPLSTTLRPLTVLQPSALLRRMDSPPRTTNSNSPLKLERLPLNVTRERPAPSKSNPTNDKDGRASSLRHNITLTTFGSPTTQIPSNRQRSDTFYKSCLPQVYEDRPGEVFALPNHTSAVHHSCSSTSTHTSDARESGNLEGNERVAGIDEKFTEEIAVTGEGAQVTEVPCNPSVPVQLTVVPGEGLKTIPARTATASQPLSAGLQPSSTTSQPSTASQLSTPLRLSSTAPQFSSGAPYIPCSAPNFRQGTTIPLPRPIPLSHSFVNTISRPWTRFSYKGQCTQPSISPAMFRSLSTAQKRPSKPQPRCFGLSHVSSATPLPFQQRSFGAEGRSDSSSSNSSTSRRVCAPPNHTFASHRSCRLTSIHVNDTRDLRDLKTSPEIVGTSGQVTKEARVAEGEEVLELVTMPARTSPSSTASRSSPTRLYDLNSTPLSTTPTSLSMHDGRSIFPAQVHNLYQYHLALRSHPSTHGPPKRRCSSLPPVLRQLENSCGQQLSRSELSIPMVSNGCQTFSSTCQPTPFWMPSSTLCQWLHHAQTEPSRTLPSQADPTVVSKRCASSLTPNMHTPSSCSSKSYQPISDTRRQLEALQPPDVPTVDNEGRPSSATCNNNLAHGLTTPTTSWSILWGPNLSEESPTDTDRATSTILDSSSSNNGNTIIRSHDFIPLYGDDPKGWNSSEFEGRVTEVINRVTGEAEGERRRMISIAGTCRQLSPISLPSGGMIPKGPTSSTGKGICLLPSTYQLAPSFPTDLCSNPGQQQHDLQNEHSGASPSSHPDPFTSVRAKAAGGLVALSPKWLPVHLPTTSPFQLAPSFKGTHHSLLASTKQPTQKPSDILLDLQHPQISKDHLDKALALLDCTLAAQCAYSSTSMHTSNAGQGLLAQGQPGNLKGNKKGIGLNEQAAGEIESVVEGQQITEGSELIMMLARTSSSSTALQPMST